MNAGSLLRPIQPSQLTVGAEGWTTLHAPATAPPAGSNVAVCATHDAACCIRHPRACRTQQQPMAAAAARAGKGQRAAAPLLLRDDLFLEGRWRSAVASHATPGAPHVVRAYDDCSPNRQFVAAAVHRARNASRAAQRALAASPLPVVAVIYFGTHFERLPLLRAAYEPYFQRIVYMSPRAEVASALRPLRAAASTSQSSSAPSLAPSSATHRATAHPYHCGLGLKLTYACVADIALTHGASDPGLRGVLFFHFDLWIQPWRLFAPSPAAPEGRGIGAASPTHLARSPLLDRTWALPAGRIMLKAGGSTRLLPIECFNVSSPEQYRLPYPAWTWERDLPPARAALRKLCGARSSARGSCGARARRAPSQRCAQPDRLCVGWADLYYVPRGRHARFAELARVFASTGSNAELALPTMLHALNDHSSAAHPADVASPSGSDGGARAAVEAAKQDTLHRPRCWGYCCSSTTCPELLARHACGHRMQLAEPRVRRAFSELMNPS